MRDWSQFLTWAKRFIEEVDLDAEERNYKLAMGIRLHDVTEAARRGDPDWIPVLRRALQSSNLLSWQFVDSLLKAALLDPSPFRDAILGLVESADPVGQLDGFAEAVRAVHPSATPGNLAAFGSVLLMSMDPPIYPPYRPEPVADWARSVGVAADTSSVSQRYRTLLELCDGLLGEADAAQLPVRDRLDAQGLAWTVLKYQPPVRWTPLEQAQLTAWRGGEDPASASVDRSSGVAPKMEEGAWLVLGRGLRSETSAIDPRLQTWTVENARELRRRIRTDPPGGAKFMDKLAGQLAGADEAVIVLLAELLYLRNAPLHDMRQETKVERIATVLYWGSVGRPLPPPLIDALEGADAFTGGHGYHAQTPAHLLWLTRFVEHWLETSTALRAEGLRDPYALRDITASTPVDVPSIRYVIEYLAWPGVFPSVVSANHRARIHAALMVDLGEPSGSDDRAITRDLSALQAFHHRKAKVPERYVWYRPPYKERWDPGDTPPRAWLIRPGDGGSALVELWLAEGFVSLSAKMLGTVEPGSPERRVAQAVKDGYAHLDASQREATTAAYHAFLTRLKEQDVVATIEGVRLFAGVVTGLAHYVDEAGSRLRRDVLWAATPVEQRDLAAPLPSLLDQPGTVVDATAAYDILAALIAPTPVGVDDDTEPPPLVPRPGPAITPRLPSVSVAVAGFLNMARADLQEIVDLLQRRQQLVLYGPPGTGKTYVAKELAKNLVGDPSRVRLVQFHPSYSYEDFFEGYRPVTLEGQMSFELKDGPLRLLAAEAKNEENRENVYILIIDEMNRANLAKVFGELYFLLEYRKETVSLQYRPDEAFFLPPNLFIIGTMNTADRSIALVDAAIRRRFPFYEMHPSQEPVKGVLGRYLEANHITDDRAALLTELNRRMGEGGRDLQIGPSYLMRPEIRSEADIDLVWRYDILPLLDEHYYGQMGREAVRFTFGIDAIRKAIEQHGSPVVDDRRSSSDVADAESADESIDLSVGPTAPGSDEYS